MRAPNRVRISGATVPGLTGTPMLAAITFEGVGPHGSSSPLSLSSIAFSDDSGRPVVPALSPGAIIISGTSAGTMRVQPPSLVLMPGASGTVDIEATAPTLGLGGWSVDLQYDPTLAQSSDCTPRPGATCNPAAGPGLVRLTGASSPALTGTVVLATLTLTATGSGRTGALTLDAASLVAGSGSAAQPVLEHGSVTVGAADTASVRITPPSGTIPAGDSTGVSLEATAPPGGLGSWVVDLAYPTTDLTLTTCSAGTGGVCNASFGSGLARVSGATATGMAGTVQLATLTFEATASVGTVLTLTPQVVALTNEAGKAVVAAVAPGTLTVTALPVIQSLAPPAVTASSGAFTLTVSGTGFQPGAVIRWNGQDEVTTYQSPTALSAPISADRIAAPGSVAITVRNPAPDNTIANAVTLPVNLPSLPAAPTGLVITRSTPLTVALGWTDNASNETSYRVLRNGNELATRPADTTAFFDEAVSRGVMYTYSVVAANLAGDSPPSTTVTVTPVCAPTMPGKLRAGTRTRTTIPLLWDDLATSETAYQVSWSLLSPVGWSYVDLPADASSWTHSPVADGKEYLYAVRACTGSTCSAWSPTLAVTSLVPSAPLSLRLLTVSATAIEIGWTNSAMYSTTLQVVWTPASPPSYSVVDLPAGATSWTHSGLSAGQSFFYWVRACAGGQCSDLTGALSGTVGQALTPTGLQVAPVTSSSVTVAWNTGAYRATSFQVIWAPAETQSYTTVVAPNSATTWTHTGLEPGRSYFYCVQACNAIGCSSLAGAVSAVTAGGITPAQPAGLRTGATADEIIVLLWDDIAITETSYQLIWATRGIPVYHTVALAANSSVHIQTGIPVGEDRHYWLRSCISLLCSNLAGAVTASAYTSPAAPGNLRASTVMASSIQLLWNDVATNETAYEVVWKQAGNSGFNTVPLGAGVSQWTMNGAVGGQRYAFWVRACRGVSCSEYTGSISITAGSTPAGPTGNDRLAAASTPPPGGRRETVSPPDTIAPPLTAIAPDARAGRPANAVPETIPAPPSGRLPLPRVSLLAPYTERILPHPPASAPAPAPLDYTARAHCCRG